LKVSLGDFRFIRTDGLERPSELPKTFGLDSTARHDWPSHGY
jgi:hypothetical protein